MDFIDKKIEDYCRAHTTPLPELFTRLRDVTYQETTAPQMQVGLLEGRFLGFLVQLTNAKLVVELGTFTGFSALAMASALPEGGKLITLDIDPRNTAIAQRFWNESPHGKKIELRLGPGLESLDKIEGPIDLAFIDADKAGYRAYWDKLVPKLRTGGLMVVDNVLWSGAVLDPKEKSDFEIAQFNQHARADARMEVVMLTVRDGMLLARKK